MLKRIWNCITKRKKHGNAQKKITFGSLKHDYGYERQELIGWDAKHPYAGYTHIYDTSARIH